MIVSIVSIIQEESQSDQGSRGRVESGRSSQAAERQQGQMKRFSPQRQPNALLF